MNRISAYPVLSNERHVPLISDLINSIDEFIAYIAPEGYDNSPYRLYFRPSAFQAYIHFRVARVGRYIRARQEGRPYTVTSLPSMEQWVRDEYQPDDLPVVMPDEPVALLLIVFLQMYFHGFIYDRNQGRYDYRMNHEEIFVIISESMKTVHIGLSPDFSFKGYLKGPYHNLSEKDRDVIHKFIFNFLLARGLEFYHECEYLKFIVSLSRELDNKSSDEDMGKNEIIANFLNLNEGDAQNPEGEYPDFSSAFQDIANSEPMEILLAYKEVYKVWPEGYPPVVDDYI